MKSNGRKRIFKILYVAIVSAAIVLCLELALRLDAFQPTYISRGNSRLMLDRDLLFKVVPNSNVDINSMGYRDTEFNRENTGRHRILTLGDSFTFGIGVTETANYPWLLESMLGPEYEVYNFGVYSYGPDQSLVQLESEAIGFQPEMVILCLYPANDFGDITNNGLFKLDGKGLLVKNDSNPVVSEITGSQILYDLKYIRYRADLWRNGGRNAIDNYDKSRFGGLFELLFRDRYDYTLMKDPDSTESRQKIKLMWALLKEFSDTLRSRGVDFLVVILPSETNISDPKSLEEMGIPTDRIFKNEEITAALCKLLKIPYIDFTPVFLADINRDNIFGQLFDHHLSIYGNKLVASYLRNYITGDIQINNNERPDNGDNIKPSEK